MSEHLIWYRSPAVLSGTACDAWKILSQVLNDLRLSSIYENLKNKS